MNNQNTIYVEYSQYTKLKEKYEKILKEKNEYKKILKEMSANLAYTKKTHDLIKNSVQAVHENFKTIMANNTINNNGTIGNTINAFSTSATNSFETLQPKLKVFLNNSNRKLEDIDIDNNVKILFVPRDDETLDFSVSDPKFDTTNLDCSIDVDTLRDLFLAIKDAYIQVVSNESEEK